MAGSNAAAFLKQILRDTKEVTHWYALGIQLGIKTSDLKEIEKNYSSDTERCRIEVIDCWLHNDLEPTLSKLAQAVEDMGGHTNVVHTLRARYEDVQPTMKDSGRRMAAKPPQITAQPTSLEEIPTGQPVTFTIQATGTEPMNYQWQCWKPEGEEDESEVWQDLTCDGVKFQEVKAGLKLTAVQACDAGYYRCVVSNSAGSETSQCANLVVVAKLVDLVNGLSGVNDWIPLGLNLGVEISTLKAIERERITIGERRVLMLNEWQKQVPPTWSAVIQALVKMGMRHLATQLAQKKGIPVPKPTKDEVLEQLHIIRGRQMDSEDEDVPKHKQPNLEQAELQEALKAYTVKAKPTGTELGSGTYGRVIELISAGEIVAGKVFKTSSNVHPRALTNKLFGELSLMTQVHHPNVVQCKGVCLLESEAMPVLLMERLMSSLHAYVLDSTNSNIPLVTKLSILCDVASGLFYLHSHKPAIIHRDLTGTNVLLDEELRAKISDFGNARIMDLDPEATPGVFTSLPGTPDYMPPEAQGDSAKCGPSLDVFSFGHLSLFTIIQSLVHPLLSSTYIDAGEVCARSEVKRRKQYLDKAEQLLKGNPSVVALIKQCLHNDSALRPQTAELQRRLKDLLINTNSSSQTTTSTGERSTQVTSEPDEYAGLRYEPKMTDLMNEIAVKLPDKWQDIGRGLGLEECELKQIHEEHGWQQSTNVFFSSVFNKWYEGKKSPYTWEQVLKVLYQPAVGGDRVADKLKEKYRV